LHAGQRPLLTHHHALEQLNEPETDMHSTSHALSRRSLLVLAGAGVCSATPSLGMAQSEPYPSRPITLVVPFAAGGTTDIVGRVIADALSKKLGQPVVVDNRGGAGGNIGAAVVAGAKPDGYSLLMGYNGTNAINPSLYPKLSWDPVKSFEPDRKSVV
jgi:tripartite-type tricarboxylate transporter receptor subunit TctC